MGCDYYLYKECVVEYEDSNGEIQTQIIPARFEHYHREYLHGIDDPHAIERAILHYNCKLLQEDNEWYCKDSRRDIILEALQEQKIPIQNVIQIHRQLNGHWRNA